GFVSVDGLDGFGGGHQGLLEPLLRCVKPRLAERKRSAPRKWGARGASAPRTRNVLYDGLPMAADPRQVPTLPVSVEVELVTGRTMRATLFLSITSARREGPETLDEFLNTQRRLLPVADGERRELLTREAIVTVRVTSDIAPRTMI